MNLLASLFTLGAWALWGYIVLFVNPGASLAPAAFYAALFVALTGTLSRLLGGAPQPRDERFPSSVMPNLGHAAAISPILLFALWLQSLAMLTPLNGILLAATLLLIELGFFLTGGGRSSKSRRRPRRAATPEAGSAVEH